MENFNNSISNFLDYFRSGKIKFLNNKLYEKIKNFTFYQIVNNNILENQVAFSKLSNSNVVVIDYYQNMDEKPENIYFIISFDKTLIILEKSLLNVLNHFLTKQTNLKYFFISNSKSVFDQYSEIQYEQIESNIAFDCLTKKLSILNTHEHFIIKIWQIICPCISCCLIQESFFKINKNRLKTFTYKKEEIIIKENDIVNLGVFGIGSTFRAELIYYIDNEELYIIKRPNCENKKNVELIKREIGNYLSISHPFLPKFINRNEDDDSIIIEFIRGQTLYFINNMKLNDKEKLTIIFELMLVIQYLHSKKFIFRDLKPTNVMIDLYKNAILIDFDRMINIENIDDDNDYTQDFGSTFIAPEVNFGNFTLQSDIYSLGKMIYYIMIENKLKEINSDEYDSKINEIYEQCIKKDPKERPEISYLIFDFYVNFHNQIQIEDFINDYSPYFMDSFDEITINTMKDISENDNDPMTLNGIGVFYYNNKYDINKALYYFNLSADLNCAKAYDNLGIIYLNNDSLFDAKKGIHYLTLAAEQNNLSSQINLSNLYYVGKYVKQDINKMIYYSTLAADQNDALSQNNIGMLYLHGKYIEQNVNKGLHYLTLAANQNNPQALNNLAFIYLEGIYIKKDVNKAIELLTNAVNQNFPNSQFILGLLYLDDFYNKKDISKGIYYLKLSASGNFVDAQLYLGILYHIGMHVPYDIEKAIYYYTQASKHPVAQWNLFSIYFENKYQKQDINKSLYYLSLAANQNCSRAQFYLGMLLEEGKYINKNVNKAIQYYFLAANQNDSNAQFKLGNLYFNGQYLQKDLGKAFHYFCLSADQNNSAAQFFLGLFYKNGIYINKDIKKAINYFKLSANQNNPDAQFCLGIIYSEGKYNSKNINEAIFYYTLAANQNHPRAQFNLGSIYDNGIDIPRDLDKAIKYYTLAANQNDVNAQFNLGVIYEKEHIIQDINKAIYYYSLAANQNFSKAQYNLANIYDNGEYIQKDIEKAIYYYSLAANNNEIYAPHNLGMIYLTNDINIKNIEKGIYYLTMSAKNNVTRSQFVLGSVFLEGKIVTRDVNKAIYYFTMAAEQNEVNSQCMLGNIYLTGDYIKPDVNKAIFYFQLAAKKNNAVAQNNLGTIYIQENFHQKNINKALHYFYLAAKHNYALAQFNLGLIYYQGIYVKRDVQKAIHYFKLASKQNDSPAQLLLGIILYEGEYIQKNIEKALYLITESLKGAIKISSFVLGFLYHQGQNIQINIEKSVHFYKEASSFNNDFAKNNLAIIYKNGYGNKLPKNIAISIEYLQEAIHQKKNIIAMHNLANIYLYEEQIENSLEESIKLLIQPSIQNFTPSIELLALALIKKIKTNTILNQNINYKNINNEMKKYLDNSHELSNVVLRVIKNNAFDNDHIFKEAFNCFKHCEFLFNYNGEAYRVKDLFQRNTDKIPMSDNRARDISQDFYEGFGL